jgi:hypothetical protein
MFHESFIHGDQIHLCKDVARGQHLAMKRTKGINVYVGGQILASGSLLRSGQTQVGDPMTAEHAQCHYFASVTTQTLR